MKIDKKLAVKQVEIEDNHGAIGHNSNISLLIREAHGQLEMSQRHCPASLFETMKSNYYDELDNGFFVHLVLYADGETIAIVPKSETGVDKALLDEQTPPKAGDYLKKECFIYFFDDYAIFLNSGMSDIQIRTFLTDLLQKSKAITDSQKINISDIADADVVAKIRRYGVKKIRLKTKIDAGTWLYTKPDNQNTSFVDKITESITKLLRKDIELTEEEINSYEYSLSINHKGVLEAVEKDPLIAPAIDVFNEGEVDEDVTYEIVLNNNKGSVKSQALKLDLPVKITRKGNSLDVDNVKEEFLSYKKDLIEREILNVP